MSINFNVPSNSDNFNFKVNNNTQFCLTGNGDLDVTGDLIVTKDITSRNENITQLVKNTKATEQNQIDSQTWVARSASEVQQWYGVAWSPELSLFCAVAESGANVMTSPDGTTWTSITAAEANQWHRVAW